MLQITESILYQLEEKLASKLGEHADMCDIEQLENGDWCAVINYDGHDDAGYKASIRFSFAWRGQWGIVEDFALLGFYGNQESLFKPNLTLDGDED